MKLGSNHEGTLPENIDKIRAELMALRDMPPPKAPGEGGWYSRFNPQPIEIIEKWNLDHHRASIIQYLVRSDAKGGVEDLKKARWYLDRLIEQEEKRAVS